MKVLRFAATTAVSGAMLVMAGGSALAADTVSVTDSGPGSNQQTTINNTNTVITKTDNNVSIVNITGQNASTGDVKASDNTTVGPLGSGDASNNSSTSTIVTINNPSTGTVGGGGTGGSGGTTGGSGGATGGTSPGGSVLGASTGSVVGSGSGGILPVTGASVPVDVSALRALYHPAAAATQSVVKHSNGISTAFLVLAGLLSLMGAIGSVVFTNRRASAH